MIKNRKAAEAFIIKHVHAITQGGENKAYLEKFFAGLSDDEFDKLMDDFYNEEACIPITVPNFEASKDTLSTKRNLKVAEDLGHEFMQRIWIEADGDRPAYLTPIPYLVFDTIARRQAQLQVKKMSVPENNSTVDDLTGQPAGKSQSARFSMNEIAIAAALGLDETLVELIKARGGDTKLYQGMLNSISKTGQVSMGAIEHLAGGVESTWTLKAYLTAMHLENTL